MISYVSPIPRRHITLTVLAPPPPPVRLPRPEHLPLPGDAGQVQGVQGVQDQGLNVARRLVFDMFVPIHSSQFQTPQNRVSLSVNSPLKKRKLYFEEK